MAANAAATTVTTAAATCSSSVVDLASPLLPPASTVLVVVVAAVVELCPVADVLCPIVTVASEKYSSAAHGAYPLGGYLVRSSMLVVTETLLCLCEMRRLPVPVVGLPDVRRRLYARRCATVKSRLPLPVAVTLQLKR